jgi:hypothetical protein
MQMHDNKTMEECAHIEEGSLYFDQNKTLQSSPSTHLIKLDVDDDLCFHSKLNHSICK